MQDVTDSCGTEQVSQCRRRAVVGNGTVCFKIPTLVLSNASFDFCPLEIKSMQKRVGYASFLFNPEFKKPSYDACLSN